MRMPSVAPSVARSVSIALAVAAVAILVFTAISDSSAGHGAGGGPAAAGPGAASGTPSRPVSPAPASTMPGSIDLPSSAPPAKPKVRASDARSYLKALAGKWTQDSHHNYFQFHADGSGEWVAFGQKLWTGKATPRNATTFDLSDPNGQGASYWRVQLVGGGKKLFFAGTQTTYRRA